MCICIALRALVVRRYAQAHSFVVRCSPNAHCLLDANQLMAEVSAVVMVVVCGVTTLTAHAQTLSTHLLTTPSLRGPLYTPLHSPCPLDVGVAYGGVCLATLPLRFGMSSPGFVRSGFPPTLQFTLGFNSPELRDHDSVVIMIVYLEPKHCKGNAELYLRIAMVEYENACKNDRFIMVGDFKVDIYKNSLIVQHMIDSYSINGKT